MSNVNVINNEVVKTTTTGNSSNLIIEQVEVVVTEIAQVVPVMHYSTGFNVTDAYAKTPMFAVDVMRGVLTTDFQNLTRTHKASEQELIDFTKSFSNSSKVESGKMYYIVLVKPVSNSRLKPYKVENVLTDVKRKYKLSYELIRTDNSCVVGSALSKFDAIEAAKTYVNENHVNIKIRVIKDVAEGEPLTATVNYTPSKNVKKGSYLFFTIG